MAGVLGLEDEIGSIEPGKKADIITLDLNCNSGMFPLSPQVFYSILALNGAGSTACDVLIDGTFVRRNAEFTTLDEEAIIAHAREWCEKFGNYYRDCLERQQPMFRRVYPEFQPAGWRKA
jgi:cytosine/adenosine deaminase-related metal-dependent hydrolase